jgi:coenzyme F420-reducing hydrogenase beta subunit
MGERGWTKVLTRQTQHEEVLDTGHDEMDLEINQHQAVEMKRIAWERKELICKKPACWLIC